MLGGDGEIPEQVQCWLQVEAPSVYDHFKGGGGKEDGPNERLCLNYLPTMGIAKGKLEHAFWQLSASHPPPPGWRLQECCELMDEAWWEQERGVWERDRELWCDSGQCVKKRDGAIVFLLFSRNVFKINIDSPIWCDLGLRCLAQVHNGHRVHESLHLLFESTAFRFPAQIPQIMEDIRRLLVQRSSRSYPPLFPWARYVTPGCFG